MKNPILVVRFWGTLPLLFLAHFTLIAQKDSSSSTHIKLFPVISRSIETGWSFGTVGSLTFHPSPKDTISRTSNMQLLFLYSTKKQLVTALNGVQYFNRENFILSEQFSYSSFPDKFWGLGKNRPDNAEEPYKYRQYYIYLHLQKKLIPGLFLGLIFERQRVWDVSYVAGGWFDQQDVKGRYGYQVMGLGASITYDKRNQAFSPNKGFFGQLSFNHFSPFWGTDFMYTNYVMDLRKYIPLSANSVLALQLYNFSNTGDVPIRSLASFGGANRMRGYYDGRYKDNHLLIFQSEFRFPVYKRFSAVAFGGTGNVSHRFTDYSLNELQYSFGGGIRFAVDKKEKLNIRMDYGIGSGNNRGLYLQLGEAF